MRDNFRWPIQFDGGGGGTDTGGCAGACSSLGFKGTVPPVILRALLRSGWSEVDGKRCPSMSDLNT